MHRSNDVLIQLEFETADFVEAKGFVIGNLPSDVNLLARAPSDLLAHGPAEAAIFVKIAYVAIPSLSGLIALWLGKGKGVTVKTKGRSLTLKNLPDETIKQLVEKFLQSEAP